MTGSFNNWSSDANPLRSEGKGFWYADVRAAKIGDEYRYLLQTDAQMLSRIDPYAREVTNSIGNGVIHDPHFDWEGDAYQLPPPNELVIYELHVGTFNDKPGGKPGTLDNASKKLSHLKRLGVNAIEVMPVAEFAGDFSWGYNPAFPCCSRGKNFSKADGSRIPCRSIGT